MRIIGFYEDVLYRIVHSAATQINLLKYQEKRRSRNTAVCGKFASSRNLQQTNLTRFVGCHSCSPSR